jgi:ABC-type antimicrobial peptide transport system permease subunit
VLGLLFSYLLTLVAQYFQIDWFFSLPLDGIVVSLLFSLACGLLFGYRPAKQAARLDPVTALRTE